MSDKLQATLLLKVPGREPVAVRTNIPTTLRTVKDNKMIGYSNSQEVGVIPDAVDKKRIVTAWDGWRMSEYEVVWSGASEKSLSKSSLKNQKGLLMPDCDMGDSATKNIMDHMQMMDAEDKVDPTELSKLKKGKKIKG